MPANYALTDQEGARLLETARLFRWERDVSGVLFGGWVALAPICGALQWRPHGWITGEAGCGKTTAIEDFAYPLLNGVAVYAQGNSSEAGIRQDLAGDSLPVVFDELEANNERRRHAHRRNSRVGPAIQQQIQRAHPEGHAGR